MKPVGACLYVSGATGQGGRACAAAVRQDGYGDGGLAKAGAVIVKDCFIFVATSLREEPAAAVGLSVLCCGGKMVEREWL